MRCQLERICPKVVYYLQWGRAQLHRELTKVQNCPAIIINEYPSTQQLWKFNRSGRGPESTQFNKNYSQYENYFIHNVSGGSPTRCHIYIWLTRRGRPRKTPDFDGRAAAMSLIVATILMTKKYIKLRGATVRNLLSSRVLILWSDVIRMVFVFAE
jgi:hypothetical protein